MPSGDICGWFGLVETENLLPPEVIFVTVKGRVVELTKTLSNDFGIKNLERDREITRGVRFTGLD